MKIKEGHKLNLPKLPSTFGSLDVERYKNKWSVLFFYHKDFAAGCQLDFEVFLKSYQKLKSLGAELIGVSPDPLEQHFKFAVEKGISFELVSDTNGELASMFNALKSKNPLYFKKKAFLISPNLIVLKSYDGKKTALYPLEIIYDIEFLLNFLSKQNDSEITLVFNDSY